MCYVGDHNFPLAIDPTELIPHIDIGGVHATESGVSNFIGSVLCTSVTLHRTHTLIYIPVLNPLCVSQSLVNFGWRSICILVPIFILCNCVVKIIYIKYLI